jgi:hypothetical protein
MSEVFADIQMQFWQTELQIYLLAILESIMIIILVRG